MTAVQIYLVVAFLASIFGAFAGWHLKTIQLEDQAKKKALKEYEGRKTYKTLVRQANIGGMFANYLEQEFRSSSLRFEGVPGGAEHPYTVFVQNRGGVRVLKITVNAFSPKEVVVDGGPGEISTFSLNDLGAEGKVCTYAKQVLAKKKSQGYF